MIAAILGMGTFVPVLSEHYGSNGSRTPYAFFKRNPDL